jgi:hypothetical protein
MLAVWHTYVRPAVMQARMHVRPHHHQKRLQYVHMHACTHNVCVCVKHACMHNMPAVLYGVPSVTRSFHNSLSIPLQLSPQIGRLNLDLMSSRRATNTTTMLRACFVVHLACRKSLVAITTTMLHNDIIYKSEAKYSQNFIFLTGRYK